MSSNLDMDTSVQSQSNPETPTIVRFRYVEAHGRTYRKKLGDSEDADLKNYVLNFVMEIKAEIEATEDDPEGGHIVEISLRDRGPYAVFLPASAWHTTDRFFGAIRKEYPGLPPLFHKFNKDELHDYGVDKLESFVTAKIENGELYLKKRITKCGFQSDPTLFILGQNAVFSVKSDVVKRVNLTDTEYIWTSGLMTELTIPAELGQPFDPLRPIADILPKRTFHGFCMLLGSVLMGVHHKYSIGVLKRCPTTIAIGYTNTGKSLSACMAINILASDAANVLEHKSITASALREVFSKQTLPVLLHDPSDPDVMNILVEETYESKALSNYRGRIVPQCAAIVTCNPDLLAQCRKNNGMRMMSRCVLVPFDEQVELTAGQQLTLRDILPEFCRNLTSLLVFSPAEFKSMSAKIDEVRPRIQTALSKYELKESAFRIASNIGLVFAFAAKALEALKSEQAAEAELLEFLLKDVVKASGTWQTPPSINKKAAEIPLTPTTPTKMTQVAKLTYCEILEQAFNKFEKADISKFARIFKQKNDPIDYLAFRDGEVITHLRGKGENVDFLLSFRVSLAHVAGHKMSSNVRYEGRVVKAVLIPMERLSKTIYEAMDYSVMNLASNDKLDSETPRTSTSKSPDRANTPITVPTKSNEPSASDADDLTSFPSPTPKQSEPPKPTENLSHGTKKDSSAKRKLGLLEKAPPTKKSPLTASRTEAPYCPQIDMIETKLCQKIGCGGVIEKTDTLLCCSVCRMVFHASCEELRTRSQLNRIVVDQYRCTNCVMMA